MLRIFLWLKLLTVALAVRICLFLVVLPTCVQLEVRARYQSLLCQRLLSLANGPSEFRYFNGLDQY
jgi:hypothetical protein